MIDLREREREIGKVRQKRKLSLKREQATHESGDRVLERKSCHSIHQ